jgi:type II secretory pathway component PulK
MRRQKSRTRQERGSVLIIAIIMLAIFGAVLATTFAVLSHALRVSGRAAGRSRVRQALDTGLSLARARLEPSDAQGFTLDGEQARVSYEVVCKPLAQDRCRIEVTATSDKGLSMRSTVDVRRAPHPHRAGAWVWKIERYAEEPI